MGELFNRLAQILEIISKGGPQAIITILIVDIILMAFANYFIARFLVNFIKEQNAARDKLLADKDQVIKERIDKMEDLVLQYNKAQMDSVDAIRKIESAIHELKNLILFMNTKITIPSS